VAQVDELFAIDAQAQNAGLCPTGRHKPKKRSWKLRAGSRGRDFEPIFGAPRI
jgi:hypothetical protein